MSSTSMETPTKAALPDGLPFPKISLETVRRVVATPNGALVATVAVLLSVVFWGYIQALPREWFKTDSYIQHGVLVPFATLYLCWLTWRENRETLPVKPTYWPAALLLPMTLLSSMLVRSGLITLNGLFLIGCVYGVVWIAMGGAWLRKLLLPIGFLIFGMTFWAEYIDQMTLTAQQVSSKLAFLILKVIQLKPYVHPEDPNLISMPHFEMNVGTACSGLKLTLAILTASAFIALVGKLGWWKNLVLLGAVLPLALVVNSVRVALVGVVGEFGGKDAGMWMHDYGSYGVMLIAFWLLYRLAVALGWKI